MRTIVFGSLLLFVLQACGNASSPEYESGDGTARHVSIAYLKSLCRGVLHPVTEDLWIEGCVVGNDLYGEFPDALVVEDESGGIEVLIDAKRLYRTFDSGSTVRVYCNGLALGDYGGKVQLGLPPTAEYILDRISAESLGRHVRRIGDGSVDFVPRELSFGEVAASRIATYVRFRRVRFAHEEVGLPFCLRDSETGRLLATDRHLVDERNDTLIVRFAASCTYAEEPAPAGMGTVSAVCSTISTAIICCELPIV